MISKSLGKVSKLKGIKGENSDGTKYASVDQMWNLEFNPEFKCIKEVLTGDKNATTIGTKDDWYRGSVQYWNQQPATVDGVLGGYGAIHDADSATSG